MGLRQIQLDCKEAVLHRKRRLSHRLVLPQGGELQRSLPLDQPGDSDLAVGGVGIVFGGLDVALGDKFQPHSLPDAGGARIIAAGGCVEVGLFSLGLQAAADVVLHSHKQRVGARDHMFCDVKTEGGIATFVGAHQSSVDIHGGLVVHSAKVQQDPSGQFLLAELKVSAVGYAVDKISIAKAFVKKLREGYKLHVNEVDDVLNAPETMTKVAMYNEEVDAAVGAEEAKRRFGDKIQIMASGDYWVDFVDVHSGKGNALQKLCNRLGITKREEVVAFGDNCNDVSMLLEAGKSYAVTTAREEAKQAARYVLEKPGPDSVLNVLKMILEL